MTPKVFPQRVRSHRHNSTSDLPARSLGDPIETGGEFFAGGRSVSLILDPSTHRLKLLLSDGEAEQIDSIFEYAESGTTSSYVANPGIGNPPRPRCG